MKVERGYTLFYGVGVFDRVVYATYIKKNLSVWIGILGGIIGGKKGVGFICSLDISTKIGVYTNLPWFTVDVFIACVRVRGLAVFLCVSWG